MVVRKEFGPGTGSWRIMNRLISLDKQSVGLMIPLPLLFDRLFPRDGKIVKDPPTLPNDQAQAFGSICAVTAHPQRT
jgi:hypothetical protein